MAYLIAKQFDKPGCIAIQKESGEALTESARRLAKMTIHTGVQVSVVYSEEDFQEYAPQTIFEDHDEFYTMVLDLAEW
ncbi:MAG: DUF6718 family protein, partial [Eubacterium sp.]